MIISHYLNYKSTSYISAFYFNYQNHFKSEMKLLHLNLISIMARLILKQKLSYITANSNASSSACTSSPKAQSCKKKKKMLIKKKRNEKKDKKKDTDTYHYILKKDRLINQKWEKKKKQHTKLEQKKFHQIVPVVIQNVV